MAIKTFCTKNRFVFLLIALAVLLLGYPYPADTRLGAFIGGMISLLLMLASVYTVWVHRRVFIVSCGLMLVTAVLSIHSLIAGTRGDPLVEGAFSVFYAYMTVVIFLEVIRTEQVRLDTIYGTVCVYLLIGVTFGTLYDLIETLHPGSFQWHIVTENGSSLGWRQLIFYSFMTLTTVGYGDITPVTSQAQSLAIVEGTLGVLYVAVLIARIVGIYSGENKLSG